MFENIIGQPAVVQTLAGELEAGTLPASMLLYGPRFSGKLSAALEIARVLTCQEHAQWACGCPSCRKQRLLVHPNTVLMGSRYFELEIAACADTLRRNPKPASCYLFIRAVRKLTRRFDPQLWEGEESRVRSLQPLLAEVEERLDGVLPVADGGAGLTGKKLEAQLDKLQELTGKLASALSVETIPINQIRRAAAWLHMTALNAPSSGGGAARKVVILENADRMKDSSSNSLLKLLEEPPADVHLILITRRRDSLIATVRSRLRPYLFVERSREAEREVLERIFHEQGEDYQGLREYFLYWNEVNPQQLRSLAQRFVGAVLGGAAEGEDSGSEYDTEAEARAGRGVLDELVAAVSSRSERSRKDHRNFVLSFLEELLRQLHLLLRQGGMSPFRLERWNRAIRDQLAAFEGFNQAPALALESLYYTLKGLE
ncbi:MAG: hypothetical protein JW820_07430 [Spirochaetales bacterium]|nr:hypothetical protein [Spirochaetales bacterium]